MNEAETRAELIDPQLREAGWGVLEGTYFTSYLAGQIAHYSKRHL